MLSDMVTTSAPFRNEQLDVLRSEQRRFVRSLPAWALQYILVTEPPDANERLDVELVEWRIRHDIALLLDGFDERQDLERAGSAEALLSLFRRAKDQAPVDFEQLRKEADLTDDEERLSDSRREELRLIVTLSLWADHIADDDYRDERAWSTVRTHWWR